MFVLGTHTDARKKIVPVDYNDLRYHTVIIGQSGSGKSYFITRLLEEIILKTRGRLLIIDPNGDFASFHVPREEDYWSNDVDEISFENLRNQNSTYDDFKNFTDAWLHKRFVNLSTNVESRIEYRPDACSAKLTVHWTSLHNEQDFFLDIDPIQYPKLYQGTVICNHYVDDHKEQFPNGAALEDLEQIAKDFAFGKIARADVPEASMLNESDWLSVRLAYRQIRKRYYKIWPKGELRRQQTIVRDLSDYIAEGFVQREIWQACVVGLAAHELGHMLFAANATLDRVWKEATHSWSKARWKETLAVREGQRRLLSAPVLANQNGDDSYRAKFRDQRVPTFIVIDEAHNFAPEEPSNPLQARVSDKIAQIAAEGRKYGIYLILATQRPKKLRRGLLSECENSALLRIQSKVERTYAGEALGIPSDTTDQIGSFGSGTALMHGRWVPASIPIQTAPVRTVLGGGSLNSTYWTQSPEYDRIEPDTKHASHRTSSAHYAFSAKPGSVVLTVQQDSTTANDHESLGFITVRIGKPTHHFTTSGKMIPKFSVIPTFCQAILLTTPAGVPDATIVASSGTTFDFNVHIKSKEYGVHLPPGEYKFQYELRCRDASSIMPNAAE